jgi:hypothetical protein
VKTQDSKSLGMKLSKRVLFHFEVSLGRKESQWPANAQGDFRQWEELILHCGFILAPHSWLEPCAQYLCVK